MSEVYGTCRFCGQIVMDVGTKAMNQKKRDELASRRCDCAEAQRYDKVMRQVERAEERIDELFGAEASALDFVPIEDAATLQLLRDAATLIARKVVDAVQVKISGTVAAKISGNSKGGISVERKETTSQKLDVKE